MAHRIEYTHPEDEPLRASIAELEELKNHYAWQDVLTHFEEVAESHRKRLASEGCTQREADFSRGAIAICKDLHDVLDMFIEVKREENDEGRN